MVESMVVSTDDGSRIVEERGGEPEEVAAGSSLTRESGAVETGVEDLGTAVGRDEEKAAFGVCVTVSDIERVTRREVEAGASEKLSELGRSSRDVEFKDALGSSTTMLSVEVRPGAREVTETFPKSSVSSSNHLVGIM